MSANKQAAPIAELVGRAASCITQRCRCGSSGYGAEAATFSQLLFVSTQQLFVKKKVGSQAHTPLTAQSQPLTGDLRQAYPHCARLWDTESPALRQESLAKGRAASTARPAPRACMWLRVELSNWAARRRCEQRYAHARDRAGSRSLRSTLLVTNNANCAKGRIHVAQQVAHGCRV